MFGLARKLVRSVTGFAPAACKHLVDAAVDADVRPPESIDRLLRVADDEELAGDGSDLPPIRNGGIVRGQEQQDLRLQRIGILKLVDEQTLEALLEAAAHLGIISNQVARLEKQIEKVERAGLRLRLLVRVRARAQLFAQERGEIGVRIGLEAGELGLQLVARAGDIFPEHAGPILLAAALACLSKLAIPAEIDERPFEPAVIARRDILRPHDLFAELPRRPGVEVEGVVLIRRIV